MKFRSEKQLSKTINVMPEFVHSQGKSELSDIFSILYHHLNDMIDSKKINDVIIRIATKFNPDKIILFGSYASGTSTDDSDLDLLIIQETDLPMHQRGIDIRLALIGSKIPIDLLVYTKSEFDQEKNKSFSFLNSAIKNSKIMYERAD